MEGQVQLPLVCACLGETPKDKSTHATVHVMEGQVQLPLVCA